MVAVVVKNGDSWNEIFEQRRFFSFLSFSPLLLKQKKSHFNNNTFVRKKVSTATPLNAISRDNLDKNYQYKRGIWSESIVIVWTGMLYWFPNERKKMSQQSNICAKSATRFFKVRQSFQYVFILRISILWIWVSHDFYLLTGASIINYSLTQGQENAHDRKISREAHIFW